MKSKQALIKAKQKASQLLQANRLEAAWVAYEAISRQAPVDHEVWLNLGAIAAMQGQLERAEAALRRALILQPDLPQANVNMARLLMMKNRSQEALPYLQHYVRLQPDVLDGHYQLAFLYETLGNSAAAEQGYREALRLNENSVAILIALARMLRSNGKHEQARAQCERALQLQPKAANAYLELGAIQRELRCFDAAAHSYQQLLALAPNERENYLIGMAQVCSGQQRYDAALEFYAELFRLYPASVTGHWNYSLLLLLLGRYKEGFEQYEWRWQTPTWTRQSWGKFEQPLWTGEPLTGKTILVYAEQGLGDAIQFSRYLPRLIAQAGQVILHAPQELLALFKRIPGLQVERRDYKMARQQAFDFHLPLMSLAHLMGTTVATIPDIGGTVPYLQADPARVAEWRSRINGDGFKIGLVWGGSTNNSVNRLRSMTLAQCAALAAIPGVTLYSLQKEVDAEELRQFSAQHGLIDLAPQLNSFDDTAAAIENLDLVISVDTAVAHLAGALGRPVWTLIYQPTEWRWLLGRDDSPWYASLRLFRQTFEAPCWPTVIERVATAVRELLAARKQE